MASLMGTWSAQTEIKASVGDYKVVAYFVVHFMPNPMRGYGCELAGCKEIDNDICVRDVVLNGESDYCTSMEGKVIDWSDGKNLYGHPGR